MEFNYQHSFSCIAIIDKKYKKLNTPCSSLGMHAPWRHDWWRRAQRHKGIRNGGRFGQRFDLFNE